MDARRARIRSCLAALGISQAELARRTRILPQDLQRILDGRVRRSKHLATLAGELGVDASWLATGQGVEPPWLISQQIAAWITGTEALGTVPETTAAQVNEGRTPYDGDPVKLLAALARAEQERDHWRQVALQALHRLQQARRALDCRVDPAAAPAAALDHSDQGPS